MKNLIYLSLIISLSFSCFNSSLQKFLFTEDYVSTFDRKRLKPLKKDWRELYTYLKKGHIQKNEDGNYIYSHDLYKFLNQNILKIYKTDFLQDYENLISTFGKPDIFHENTKDRLLEVSYFPSIIGDPCETCNHDGFSYIFDANTGKLLMK